VCDTPQRTAIAAADGELHDEPVFDSHHASPDLFISNRSKDFVPLLLKTPYSARQLIDWILQAKLCVYFGDAVKNLRAQGFRTVIDLAQLTPKDIDALAAETALTKSALEHAQQSVTREAAELERLREAGQVLGTFWEREDSSTPPRER
jgi:hypothetical protein